MKRVPTEHRNLVLLEPVVHRDARGIFVEIFRRDLLRAHGIEQEFVQENFSRSKKGVLRGLHFQRENVQGKLLRVGRGEIFDVVVDLRLDARSYGKVETVVLSEENQYLLYVPPGFAHGFLTLSDIADVYYKVTDRYNPSAEMTLLWNDPDLGVPWPVLPKCAYVLSEKDLRGLPLSAVGGFEGLKYVPPTSGVKA